MVPAYLRLLLLALLSPDGLNLCSRGSLPLLYLLRPYLCLYPMLLKTFNDLLPLGLGVTHSDLHASCPGTHPRDVICLRLHLNDVVLGEEVLLKIHVVQVLREGLQIKSKDLHILIVELQILHVLEIGGQTIVGYFASGDTLSLQFHSVDSEG